MKTDEVDKVRTALTCISPSPQDCNLDLHEFPYSSPFSDCFSLQTMDRCNLSNSLCTMKPSHINSEILYIATASYFGMLVGCVSLPFHRRFTKTQGILIKYHISSSILLRHSSRCLEWKATKQSKWIIRELTLTCYQPPPHSSNHFKINWIFFFKIKIHLNHEVI